MIAINFYISTLVPANLGSEWKSGKGWLLVREIEFFWFLLRIKTSGAILASGF